MSTAIYNEYALVGAIFNLVDDHGVAPAIKHVMQIDAADFTDNFTGSFYAVMKDAILSDQPFDLITVCEALQEKYGADETVIADVGRTVKDNRSYSAIESHKKAVKIAAIKRRAMQSLLDAYNEMEQTDDPLKTLGKLESKVEAMMGYSTSEQSEFSHIADLMHEWLDEAEAILAGDFVEPGLTSGFVGLDEKLGDKLIKRGSMVVIGANPGAGKTGLMLRMAERMGEQKKDEHILIYSLEMPKAQIAERVAGMYTKNKSVKYFSDADYGNIADGLGRLKQTKILVNDNTQVTVQKIKSDARQMAASGKIACIMVDYLTLLDMPEKSRNDLSVAEVTKQLTRLAKELNCVVVLLCQLNRENMKRANKRPIKSDLRESGQIEQDAAYILFPYRDLQFNPDSPAGNYAELILDKNRFGATGIAYAQFLDGVWHDCDQIAADNSCRGSNQ